MTEPDTGSMPAFPGGGLRLRRLDAWSLRVAIERPVETSFGIMRDRPAKS